MKKKTKKILSTVLLGVTALVGGGILLFNNTKKEDTKNEKPITSKNMKNDSDLFI